MKASRFAGPFMYVYEMDIKGNTCMRFKQNKLRPLCASILLASSPAAWSEISMDYIQASQSIAAYTDISHFVSPTSISNDGTLVTFSKDEDGTPADEPDYGVYNRSTGEVSYPVTSIDGSAVRLVEPVLSGNGRFLTFVGTSDNLLSNEADGPDVFLHDLQTNETELVSAIGSAPIQGVNRYGKVSISEDGRYVTFTATFTDSDGSSFTSAMIRDRQTGQTRQIGRGRPTISGDGSTIVLSGRSENDTPLLTVYDTQSLSPLEEITPPMLSSQDQVYHVSISHDGNQIAFEEYSRAYVHNRRSGHTKEIILRDEAGEEIGFAILSIGEFSKNGRFLALQNLQDYTGNPDIRHNVFIYKVIQDEVVNLSRNTEDRGDNYFHKLVTKGFNSPIPISADGTVVAADMLASLTPEDTNNNEDIYVFEVEAPPELTGVQITNVGETSFTVTWDALQQEEGFETAYQLRLLDSETFTWSPPIFTLSASRTFSNLEEGSRHLVEVRAVNDWVPGKATFRIAELNQAN